MAGLRDAIWNLIPVPEACNGSTLVGAVQSEPAKEERTWIICSVILVPQEILSSETRVILK
ncbi:hypothetical protein PHLCEN_2v4196 [Hermanssonia centrifuga]|uniref:Uncharacterized protein n=1 Tax=Hermanssonia centrifuga TaxID=98765 RepID=A0A2R6PYZ5_9APHY|nr:hypothetical protein PHLCEN_2v4196 [Hermanssonia centrifuga]